jgi:hypothetical protein
LPAAPPTAPSTGRSRAHANDNAGVGYQDLLVKNSGICGDNNVGMWEDDGWRRAGGVVIDGFRIRDDIVTSPSGSYIGSQEDQSVGIAAGGFLSFFLLMFRVLLFRVVFFVVVIIIAGVLKCRLARTTTAAEDPLGTPRAHFPPKRTGIPCWCFGSHRRRQKQKQQPRLFPHLHRVAFRCHIRIFPLSLDDPRLPRSFPAAPRSRH